MNVTFRIDFDDDEIDAVPIGRVERTGLVQSVNLERNVTGFSFSS